VLAMALVICLRLPSMFQFACLAVIAVAGTAYHPYLSGFAVGMIFCLMHQRFGRDLAMANWVAICLSLLAAVLFSYNVIEPAGLWAWCAKLEAGSQLRLWMGIQIIAALCALSVALYNPYIRSLLSGGIGSLLGRMSFPIYLLHLFVLCSFTAWMCILAEARVPPLWFVLALYPVSALVLFLVAYPLMRFDSWWVKALNAAAGSAHRTVNDLWQRPASVADEPVR
jgi:peptidoglycan/LPS O-acetylase OafA/YrhL